MGRPSIFTPELAEEICRRLADGESLRAICRDEAMPQKETVRQWKNSKPGFLAQYMRAREDQADTYAELGIEAATTAEDPAKARLAFDAYRWAAGKLKPGTYGDKLQHTGDRDNPIATSLTVTYRRPGETS